MSDDASAGPTDDAGSADPSNSPDPEEGPERLPLPTAARKALRAMLGEPSEAPSSSNAPDTDAPS